jgi:hypothetical protein
VARVTDSQTRRGVQGVQSKYQSKGRLTAKVHLDQLDYDARRRRVRSSFTVDSGPKVKVTAVEAENEINRCTGSVGLSYFRPGSGFENLASVQMKQQTKSLHVAGFVFIPIVMSSALGAGGTIKNRSISGL